MRRTLAARARAARRRIVGTFHHVGKGRLGRYVTEFEVRYNVRFLKGADPMRKAQVAFVLSPVVALYALVLAQTTGFTIAEFLDSKYTTPQNAPSSVVIAGKDEPGERLIVTGRTLDGDKPVADVSLYVFHTDARGRYSNDTDDNRVGEYNPRLRGLLRTDAEGRYRYETTRPGSYDNGPAHVHYIVNARGYKPLLLALQFQDDPIVHNLQKAGKPLLNLDAFKNGPCKSRPDCVLTQPVVRDGQGISHVTRDIQMVKE
jgi:protocatechuate 3,4-dioxygenase beta subunit